MIHISNKPVQIKNAVRHLLMGDGVTCVHCGRDFGPVPWEPGSFIYEITYLSEHSDMLSQEPDKGVLYTNCKAIPR
jgi:hypothetical protein